jgi:hypothetical protein
MQRPALREKVHAASPVHSEKRTTATILDGFAVANDSWVTLAPQRSGDDAEFARR